MRADMGEKQVTYIEMEDASDDFFMLSFFEPERTNMLTASGHRLDWEVVDADNGRSHPEMI
ncbi:hypothetical protein SCP_0605410 [Sparassis crispa]|uniref:Uncharacterized protein n=1 Tax=Sparassis crispa TaxID=139825 RepID=A0A401GQS5_9APHY|nr:hypothetical protein SCP_0605410 [Sparassis crispa]GBE84562.1 hypothetical protein SCP_0605410 [Sparassis crispa]